MYGSISIPFTDWDYLAVSEERVLYQDPAVKTKWGDCREAYPALPREFAADFDRYFGGVPVRFAWPLRLDGTPFQNRVWQVLKIPYGCTTTYKQIGDQLETKGYRAVGSAVGANPLLIVIPATGLWPQKAWAASPTA